MRNYFEPDDTEYERSVPVKDEDGNWTTAGEIEDKELEEWDSLLDDDWDYDPGPDCDKAIDMYDRERSYSIKESMIIKADVLI